ncbi:hypothetical protein ABE41_006560 [Fictibacillus arsenicus]|uniref:DUF4065 domain-containing protein n=1 Tax=Fictibacillus arsenicus TaxID=255247 RepID=A0A1B1Z2N7_9BACL|nr:hypothetical protein [Fictibacillus arsenicus]ANX11664.1 hypothetical protein ABE41_006560 [Fictibacillus arsenicus]
MSSRTIKNSSVPLSIELLFNNEKLDIMKTLCLLYAFSKDSRKRRTVSEIMFYYSLVNFDLIKLFETDEKFRYGVKPSPNLYFRFQSKINGILLNMLHLQFINLKGDITKKLDETIVQITSTGEEFIDELNSVFFSNLVFEYSQTLEKIKFSGSNLKVVKGVQQ